MVSVRSMLDSAQLGLVLTGGSGGLDNSVTGAHSTEHPDPRPWLNGGELLMTTGMRMRSFMRVVSRSGGRRSNLRGIGTS